MRPSQRLKRGNVPPFPSNRKPAWRIPPARYWVPDDGPQICTVRSGDERRRPESASDLAQPPNQPAGLTPGFGLPRGFEADIRTIRGSWSEAFESRCVRVNQKLLWVRVLFGALCATLCCGPRASAQHSGTAVSDVPATLSVSDVVQQARQLLDAASPSAPREERFAAVESATVLTDAIRSAEPANPWLLYLYGRMNALLGRDGDARDNLRKFVETPEGRSEWTAYRVLGDLFSAEFPRLARAYYQRARELRGDDPDVLLGLSICEWKLTNYDAALGMARAAVDADGRRSSRPLAHLARVLMARKNWAEAEREAVAAYQLSSEAAHSSPGSTAAAQLADQDAELIIQILRGRIAQTPGEADLHLRLEEARRRRLEWATRLALLEILAELKSAVDRFGESVPVQLRERYAAGLAEAGLETDARAQFEALLKEIPDHAAAREWLLSHPAPVTTGSR
jgi:tetratricopeptide (TPR) repeat protein